MLPAQLLGERHDNPAPLTSRQPAASAHFMPLALDQAHALLIAELSRDAGTIAEAISAVLAMSLETNLLEVEEVFRDAGSPV